MFPTTTGMKRGGSIVLMVALCRSLIRPQARRLLTAQAFSTPTTMTTTTTTTTFLASKRGNDHNKDEATKLVQAMLQRIRAVNEYPVEIRNTAIPFYVDDAHLGLVRPAMADRLHHTGVFHLRQQEVSRDDDEQQGEMPQHHTILTLNEEMAGTTCDSRTKAVASVMRQLREDGIVTGWRDELYPIQQRFDDAAAAPAFLLERAAVPILGALEYGVHINGLVKTNDTVQMWLARRSVTKSKYPGFLDHIVAGGQPHGLSLYDNVLKECEEEAGIPRHLVTAPNALRPAGAISYQRYNRRADTIERVVLFNYDLYLPRDFVPTIVDGEVQEFILSDMSTILATMAADYPDPIKPNCNVVIIDFLLRHGFISPDTAGYLDIVRELRSGDCR